MKRFLIFIVVTIAACVTAFANSDTKANVYSNQFIGMTFDVPSGWYVATDNETKELWTDSAKVMGLDDPFAQKIVAQMPGIVLLIVSERPFSSAVQSFDRNIIFAAINAKDIKREISSGSDYLGHVARGMRESQPSATVSIIRKQRLGNEEFHRLDVTLPMQGMTAHMAQLAVIQNDYILILNMAAGSDSGLKKLVEVTDNNLRLSSVSKTIDTNPEGESFRKQSSLNMSG